MSVRACVRGRGYLYLPGVVFIKSTFCFVVLFFSIILLVELNFVAVEFPSLKVSFSGSTVAFVVPLLVDTAWTVSLAK